MVKYLYQKYRITRSLQRVCVLCFLLMLTTFVAISSTDYSAKAIDDKLTLVWTAPDGERAYGIAWGDWDNDGDLDLAAGTRVYENDDDVLKLDPANGFGWQGNGVSSDAVAWGDWDNDGDLDLASGEGLLRVYENDGGTLKLDIANGLGWEVNGVSYSIAWGDWDNDGDLDLASGGNPYGAEKVSVYENTNGILQLDIANGLGWEDNNSTSSVAWGDWDNDGDLDLAAGTRVYENENGTLKLDPANNLGWNGGGTSNSVAWGDWDNDGDLDLGIGDLDDVTVYENDEGTLKLDPIGGFGWSGSGGGGSTIAWGDWDNDGDLDLAVAQGGMDYDPYFNVVYENTGGNLVLAWSSPTKGNTASLAWGDWDNDGDLDLAFGPGMDEFIHSTRVYENQTSTLALQWSLPMISDGGSVAWGDWDGDGDLDLAVGCQIWGNGGNQVYENRNGSLSLIWSVPANCSYYQAEHNIAWGDWDSDGDLDLAIGQSDGPLRIYENTDKNLKLDPNNGLGWEGGNSTSSIAWGDWDGDGDLDLAGVVNPYSTKKVSVYENENEILKLDPTNSLGWEGDSSTSNVAWGDWDGDGDLDLAAGARIYENDGGTLKLDPAHNLGWDGGGGGSNVAWGDWDGDGDLDLAITLGKNHVFENRNGNMILVWSSPESDYTQTLAWGDWDSDGDLDLAVGNTDPDDDRQQAIQIYKNNHGKLVLGWTSPQSYENFWGIAFGDWDNDGRTDLANTGSSLKIFTNHNSTIGNRFKVKLLHPSCNPAPFFSCGKIIESPIVAMNYTVYGETSDSIRLVKAYYSLDNGSHWTPAAATDNTKTTMLAASLSGNQYIYYWDIYGSNVFGTSDNVLFRLDIYPSFKQPGPYQYSFYSIQSSPFRLRGSQVRVVDSNSQPVSGAIVQRQPVHQTSIYLPYQDKIGTPYSTNSLGYLQGYGEISIGDQLIAMQPISSNSIYSLYKTSATPTTTGLNAHTVAVGGVQTLTVSSDRMLILFDLIVSLEWDARNDATFMAQLENDLRRTSQIIYDLTNGQATLGKVRVYHDKGFWGDAHIVIHANNNLRPSAIMGGVTLTPTTDVDVNGQIIPDAYVPGQVRMGATWNRFGNPNGTLGEDWPRALAHELGHYLFFLADNYIGVKDGKLKLVECEGSNMADPYEESDSEFLTRSDWIGECLDTVANRYLERTDWESILHFYPMLNDNKNPGPSQLPLAVTQIEIFAPPVPTTALSTPFYPLVDQQQSTIVISEGQGQAYLFKTHGNSDPTDDYVIAEGVPIGDLVQARGASPGDRLCVFDYSHTPIRLGCTSVSNTPTPLVLKETPDWTPQIQVAGVTSTTIAVTVTNVTETNLKVQLLPALGAASGQVDMQPVNNTTFVQTVTAADGAFYGFVRIWVPGSNPPKEMITEYAAIEAWDGRLRRWGTSADAWGGRLRRWGVQAYGWGGRLRRWGAPVMSSDGQISIFPLENPFANGLDLTIQTIASSPRKPAWLTMVGQAYRVANKGPIAQSAILFGYLARNVPAGYEGNLRIYYSPDEGVTWQRLETELDTYRNQASTSVLGNGIYMLAATVEIPSFTQGWNIFAYPVQKSQPVDQALASIAGNYSAVYAYDATQSPPWRIYAPTVQAPFNSLVNGLTYLEYPKGYWIYATQPTTLFLDVTSNSSSIARNSHTEQLEPPSAPAVYYGWIMPTVNFAPTVGMKVFALVDGNICGETTVQLIEGQLSYVLFVAAGSTNNLPYPCGTLGKQITFKVDNWVMNDNISWNNTQAQFHSLNQVVLDNQTSPKVIYLPLIQR